MGDHKYYYDFDSEIGLRDWEIINEDEKKIVVEVEKELGFKNKKDVAM